jgi:hypothetical protein
VKLADIARRRLRASRLIGPRCGLPADVVRALCAVQSQDYPAAAWAIAQRMTRGTRAAIDRA